MQGGEFARLNLVSNLRNWLILNSSISGGLNFGAPKLQIKKLIL
jgi:hypothetical protein